MGRLVVYQCKMGLLDSEVSVHGMDFLMLASRC